MRVTSSLSCPKYVDFVICSKGDLWRKLPLPCVDPFFACDALRVPFVEFERAALCRGEAPEPFEPLVEKGLEELVVLLPSPSSPSMVLGRFRFEAS